MRKWEVFLWLWKSKLFMITLVAWSTWAFLHEDLMKKETLVCSSGKHHRMSSYAMPSLFIWIITPCDIHCVYLFFNVAQDSKLQDKFWTVTHVLCLRNQNAFRNNRLKSLTYSILAVLSPPTSQPTLSSYRACATVCYTYTCKHKHTYI